MPFEIAQRNANITDIINDIDQIRLHTGNPGANGTANQVSGGGYAHQALAAADWTVNTANGYADLGEVDFGSATAAWGTVSWQSFWDGSSFRARRAFVTPMAVASGAPVTIDADTIRVSVTSSD